MRKDSLAIILGTVALALGLAAPAGAAEPSLLASWSFDSVGQTAVDASGRGNDGRLGSSAGPDGHDPVFVDGRLGTGLAFDGTAYVRVEDTARLEPRHITVAAWVRRLGSPGKWRYVLSKGALGCQRSSYGLYSARNGGMAFYVSDSSTFFTSPLAPPSSVWDGGWHHVAGTFDGERVRLYVDGEQVGNGTAAPISIAYGVGSRGIYIGDYRGSCDLPFAGDIDEVRVWDEALGHAGIVADATRGAIGEPTPKPASSADASAPTASAGASGTAVRPRACYAVWLSRKTLVVGRRSKLVLAVRDRGRLAKGVRLQVRGGGIRRTTTTRRNGLASIVVRARWRTKVHVQVVGQRTSCPKPTIRVRMR